MTAQTDDGVQISDVSLVMRYSTNATFRASMDAQAQRNRDAANAAIDAGIARARAARLTALGVDFELVQKVMM